MSYQVHLKDREFVSLMKENTGSIGVSSEGMQGLKRFTHYEDREDQLKLYLRKQLSLCKSAEMKEILRHVLFEIEFIDTHQDKITDAFSRFFTWIIAENQASNHLLMHHDPLKWVDLRRMKRDRLRGKQQISLFDDKGDEKNEERIQRHMEENTRFPRGKTHRSYPRNEAEIQRLQYVFTKEKSGSGTGIPHRSA